MSVIVANCPRCGSERMTFDVDGQVHRGHDANIDDWAHLYEVFAVCRNCSKPSILLLRLKEYKASQAFSPGNYGALVSFQGGLNNAFEVVRHISLRDQRSIDPPEHLSDEVRAVFEEGAACLAIGCVNAAATMFRLCVDLVTEPLLPPVVEGQDPVPNRKVRRDLGLRLPWLFENKLLPADLQGLATAIKDDGNDGAHRANLTEADAEDILDFTVALLERLITQPRRVELAALRREERRKPKDPA